MDQICCVVGGHDPVKGEANWLKMYGVDSVVAPSLEDSLESSDLGVALGMSSHSGSGSLEGS